jgi:bidirectional [NiFe] hydrogenase diaphorase subunit
MDLNQLLEIANRTKGDRRPIQIRCCNAAGCIPLGGLALKENLEAAVQNAGLDHEVEVCSVGCMKLCGRGTLVEIAPEGKLYEGVKPEDAAAIVAAIQGEPEQVTVCDTTHPFFSRQMPIVLENSGKINPESIEEYIAAGGYQQLYRVLHQMTPDEVVTEVKTSGLRGRGGGGYPTGLKWATVAKMPGEQKYVVCTAEEGDPGAFMDRAVLESDPHRVLEGMAIAAYAVGANHGYIYIRAEYPLAISRLQKAIDQAKTYQLMGSQIFGSPFDFKIDIRVGAGAFVCGEETALMASIEGKRGSPHPRPPYPAESGLWGSPTLLNNVETYANIVPIVREGGAWYASIGTEKSKGTKVFSLTGAIANNGLIEVPMGISLREIVEEIGGGVDPGRQIQAVQTGGSSGGCVPAHLLDTPVEYEALAKLGSIMGSGGMVVLDDTSNVVDIVRYYMEFCMDESCGKCVPCRAGTKQLEQLLAKILSGTGTAQDLTQLETLSYMVKETSLCGLGQSAPNPVISTLQYFRADYEALLTTPNP